jgi:hypothetical protein
MARSPQQVGVIQQVEVSGSNTVVASPRACLPGHSVILERGLNTVAWDPGSLSQDTWLVRLPRNQLGPDENKEGMAPLPAPVVRRAGLWPDSNGRGLLRCHPMVHSGRRKHPALHFWYLVTSRSTPALPLLPVEALPLRPCYQ